MSIRIRQPTVDDLPAAMRVLNVAFLETPDVVQQATFAAEYWDLDRVWIADDDGPIVGTFRTWGTELTVPGGAGLPASAISAVTVQPTHRRRGVLTGMMTAARAADREAGEACMLLYASEWPIYGRYGFGPAVETTEIVLDTRGVAFLGVPPPGSVELIEPEAAEPIVRELFDAHRREQVGAIRRLDRRWRIDLGLAAVPWQSAWQGWIVLHRDPDGVVDGFARYHPEARWTDRRPDNTLIVDQLVSRSPEAYAGLWRFLAEVDLVTSLKAGFRRADEPLKWLLADARYVRETERGEGLWCSLLDVPRALAARRYERPGSLVIEVVGRADDGTPTRSRVALDASPDGATARDTDASPDLTIAASALGAAYLGGTPLRLAVLAAGVDEHRAGALSEADALFRTLDQPWCTTFF
jgi:predicted acetyltransferase